MDVLFSDPRYPRPNFLKKTLSLYIRADGQNNLLILSTLDLIQGMLLLHAQSRKLFAREIHMNASTGSSPRRITPH
jgi:hypothetical protein